MFTKMSKNQSKVLDNDFPLLGMLGIKFLDSSSSKMWDVCIFSDEFDVFYFKS